MLLGSAPYKDAPKGPGGDIQVPNPTQAVHTLGTGPAAPVPPGYSCTRRGDVPGDIWDPLGPFAGGFSPFSERALSACFEPSLVFSGKLRQRPTAIPLFFYYFFVVEKTHAGM